MRTLFLLLGLGCTGYYAHRVAMERLDQAYDNWVFEQHIAGRENVDIADYLREQTPLSFLVKDTDTAKPEPVHEPSQDKVSDGEVLGRVEIERLNLSSVVREGVDAGTLNGSVGHVPSTSLPGHPGNVALAAHRDTLFRPLKDIKQDDLITFQSPLETFTYRVDHTRIVKPTDVSVLRPGGHDMLTLITCYPFYYVGSAPERFIVQARLISETPMSVSER